jgi:hypothetical protein
MDDVAADKVEVLKNENMGPTRAMLKSIWLSDTPCLGPMGLET